VDGAGVASADLVGSGAGTTETVGKVVSIATGVGTAVEEGALVLVLDLQADLDLLLVGLGALVSIGAVVEVGCGAADVSDGEVGLGSGAGAEPEEE